VSFELSQTFLLECAHTLHRNAPVSEATSSRRIHGHTYTVKVTISGDMGGNGMLLAKVGLQAVEVDLHWLGRACDGVRDLLDHRLLDEVEGLGAPTMEGMCVFIANQIAKNYPVHCVEISRAAGGSCRFTPPSASKGVKP
jgi:6-pyruvoyltetrahydropterin/6-carboxytetrahydropterin synthase